MTWWRCIAGAVCCAVVLLTAGRSGAGEGPRVVVSIAGATLRLERGADRGRRVYPVSVGRLREGKETMPVGTLYTGPDPRDRDLYIPRRLLPAFHRGLPALRLDLRRPSPPGIEHYPFGLHGPVTPSLIWGRVSTGCVRLAAPHIKELYRFAARHPSMPVTVIRGLDRVGGREVKPDRRGHSVKGCPEAAVGAWRLQRLRGGESRHGRICGGVDHWFALELQGGDTVSLRLGHGGKLRVELYGIRAISPVAAGKTGFSFKVPVVRNNRGDRFVRVVAPTGKGKAALRYALEVEVGKGTRN